MSDYRVTFRTNAEITVDIKAKDEDDAADRAWVLANDYTDRLLPDAHGVAIEVSIDGIGADEVTEVDR